MSRPPGVEVFDFHDLHELSPASEIRASESLNIALPRAALVLSALTRRNATGALVRFELVDRRDVNLDGCDLYDLTVPVTSRPGLASTRQPLGVAVIPRESVTGMAEVLMGGPGDGEARLPNRFERSLLCRRLTEVLVPIWEGLGVETRPVPPGLTHIESTLAQLPLSTVVVGISFSIGERSWELTLAVASSLIDASLDPVRATHAVTMAQAVRDIPVEIAVSFNPVKIRASDAHRLAVGDVIRLDHGLSVPLVANSQGRPLLLVCHGTTGRRVAVEVIDVLDVAELADLAYAEGDTGDALGAYPDDFGNQIKYGRRRGDFDLDAL
ncbi:MAG: FliM/FliN family flagellar motor switch protein [Acidimicrobiales bacterium]